MHSLREAWTRIIAFFRKGAFDRDLDEELAAHVDMATDEHMRRGVPETEARRLALARLGGLEAARLRHREARGLPSLDGLLQDVRYAMRSLRRSPGFTVTAIATLAVGIGANTGVFTVTNAVLFNGFPLVHQSDRLLYITTNKGAVYYPDVEAWHTEGRTFEGLGVVRGVFKALDDGAGEPDTYFTTEVTANAFGVLGVAPFLGRDFTPADTRPGAAPVVMLRYDLWAQRFTRDTTIIGRTIRLDGVPTTVIGVMPMGFSFPADQRLWTPLIPTSAAWRRDTYYAVYAFGRMASGVTIQAARAELETIGRQLATAFPDTNRDLIPIVETFTERFVGTRAAFLYKAIWMAVAFVLLIASANVASLVLERVIGRSRELSIRTALGAGRWRVIRHGLVESALLSFLGAAVGWWIAWGAVRAYASVATGWGIAGIVSYAMDYRVLAYTMVVAVASGMVTGLAGVVRLTTLDVNRALTGAGRGIAGVRRGRRASDLLVAGEMALAVVLLAGAGVMVRSFVNVHTADLGIDTANVLTMPLYVPPDRYGTPDARIAFYEGLGVRLQALPGVASVGMGIVAPTERARVVAYEEAGMPSPGASAMPTVAAIVVDGHYFRTLGARVISGRAFNAADRLSSRPVVVVNQLFAGRRWPGGSPLGKRLRLHRDGTTPGAWSTVIGVVSDVVQNDPTGQDAAPLVYLPYSQHPSPNMFVFARTRVPPESLAAAVRREVNAMDPALPVPALMPLVERFQRAHAFDRNITVLLLVFAVVALLMASIGLYAVTAHAVSRRTQEIGVRTAIGATPGEVLALVLGGAVRPLAAGLVGGLVAALALVPLLQSVLVGVSPADPFTFTVVPVVLLASALLGCLIPARRAMRVDPVVALRHE